MVAGGDKYAMQTKLKWGKERELQREKGKGKKGEVGGVSPFKETGSSGLSPGRT